MRKHRKPPIGIKGNNELIWLKRYDGFVKDVFNGGMWWGKEHTKGIVGVMCGLGKIYEIIIRNGEYVIK